ncbi:MAG TPA: hypothetical protein VHZ03_31850 [Trebonia sp.]|jgi:hypothetical protein|nr:hypothetical protein [Trebonia sp.]
MTGALAVGICGVVLASLSLGWQAANYVLTGGRVKVRLLVGAVGRGSIVTAPPAKLSPEWLQRLAAQGFSQPIVAVNVANVGRQPVKVERWGLKSGLGMSLYPTSEEFGPRLPHRLDVGDAETWAIDLDVVRSFMQTGKETLENSQSFKPNGNSSLVGKIAAEMGRPEGADIVGVVELVDGRKKFSEGVLR